MKMNTKIFIQLNDTKTSAKMVTTSAKHVHIKSNAVQKLASMVTNILIDLYSYQVLNLFTVK